MKSMFIAAYDLLQPWRDRYNSRTGVDKYSEVALEIGTRLQHLHLERLRLKSAYKRSLAEISKHEKNLMHSLLTLVAEEKANGGG